MGNNSIIYIGIAIVIIGIAYKFGLLSWFANLPGDIKHKGENSFVFMPITSMIIVSVVASILMKIFGR